MSFLALPASTAWTLLAAVAGIIFLLYLLKPRPRRVVVSSNLIWNRVLAQSKGAAQRWRWLLSLLLASVVGLATALALTQPEVPALGGEAKRIVLVLDNAPSMSARTQDGDSRWLRAQAVARAIINQAGAASEFLVSDTMGYAGTQGYVDRKTALAQVDKLPIAVSGQARFPALPSSSDVNARLERYLVSDGVARFAVPDNVATRSVFEAADNVALVAFDARALPNDPTRYQAFLQIYNASLRDKQVSLEVSGAPDFAFTRELQVAAGERLDQIVDVSKFPGGILRARVRAAGDAFSIDDEAYAIVQPHQVKRVLLVTPGNSFLRDALRLLPGVQVTTLAPGAYRDSARYDVAVFDRFASRTPPASPVLLFRPPKADWLPEPGTPVAKPAVLRWDDRHPLAQGLAWKDVQIERAVLAKAPEQVSEQSAVVIARGSGEGALVLASDSELRWVQVGFALADSNLQLQSDFPVFLGRALAWLTAGVPAQTRSIGPIQVQARGASVTDLNGKKVEALGSGARTVFAANRPNVYTIKNEAREFMLVANVTDARFAAINDSRLDAGAKPADTKQTARSDWQPWMLLLFIAALLIALEALLFHRRVTL